METEERDKLINRLHAIQEDIAALKEKDINKKDLLQAQKLVFIAARILDKGRF
jgi:hypothetical protein